MHNGCALINSQTFSWYEFNTNGVSFLKLFHVCGKIYKTSIMSQGSSQLNKMQKIQINIQLHFSSKMFLMSCAVTSVEKSCLLNNVPCNKDKS